MTDISWGAMIGGALSYLLGLWVAGYWRKGERGTVEYGTRNPDNHDHIYAHRSLETARGAAEWWGIDNKVYVRHNTSWKVLND